MLWIIALVFCAQTTDALRILCQVRFTPRPAQHISLPCKSVIEVNARAMIAVDDLLAGSTMGRFNQMIDTLLLPFTHDPTLLSCGPDG
ncbi:hypothetical protein DFJ58DRAFT_790305 [Suillus subalutaceus]|uniref:uncharacterized protein n=1 Tax=Suillus subalutaceus TaxID=48586 RepID=UPI001B86BFA1|nr:uncharacterized protein DFJ58DRAFT_790305 [Suillus subalutaceus]KAG1852864.1 hypothetical protein DFJ58DRAFT_790305 [Suillus subalutaceus]